MRVSVKNQDSSKDGIKPINKKQNQKKYDAIDLPKVNKIVYRFSELL